MLYEEKVKTNRAAFVTKVIAIAGRQNMEPEWLMAIMNFESSLNEKAKNPRSTATGLIQFLEGTAKELGTTTAQLAAMSNVQQLDYVEKYFAMQIRRYGQIESIGEAYLAVFYPAAIAWPSTKVFPNAVYAVNQIFDGNADGKITKAEIEAKILSTIPVGSRANAGKKKAS